MTCYIIIEQQTGMPFIIMQQQQPGIDMQVFMQSQQAWIILAHIGSPLVQVMLQPMSIISILHMPIMPILQEQQVMPLHMQHMAQVPPCIIMQRFFIISAAVLSSHAMVHFIPPLIFSIFMVQRGAMIMLPMAVPMPPIVPGIIEGIMPFIIPLFIPMPIMLIAPMGIHIMLGMLAVIELPVIRSDVMLFAVLILNSWKTWFGSVTPG